MTDLGYESNKPIHYILDHGDFIIVTCHLNFILIFLNFENANILKKLIPPKYIKYVCHSRTRFKLEGMPEEIWFFFIFRFDAWSGIQSQALRLSSQHTTYDVLSTDNRKTSLIYLFCYYEPGSLVYCHKSLNYWMLFFKAFALRLHDKYLLEIHSLDEIAKPITRNRMYNSIIVRMNWK